MTLIAGVGSQTAGVGSLTAGVGWLTAGVGWLTALVATCVWLLTQRSLSARMEAVARACHELRGPITAARLGVELGFAGPGGLSAAQLAAIDSELGRATLALDDLAVVRERRTVAPERGLVDLCSLARDSVRAWGPSAAAAGRTLAAPEAPGSVLICGDRTRLAQALGNLIANAVEHGGRNVGVRVVAEGSHARLEVADDGSGLPAPISQLTRRARGGRGARGRGLAIAAGVAALHGGQLISAPAERGARLVLELPLALATDER
jgi:signal transduction histidine kinase